jgi:nitroreductase
VTNDTIKTLNNRVSIRDYTDDPLDNDTVLVLMRAARRSPTSSNLQAYSLVVVRNPETKRRLAALAGNQRHIEICPVFVAVCADISRLMFACEMHGTSLARNTENTLVAVVDAALAGMSLSLAAESLGLGTVMIGGMRNHPAEVAELLRLPEGVFVVYGLCIGWPAERPKQKPRLPEEAVVHFERYDSSQREPHLREYDLALARHYRSQGHSTLDAAWTGVIAGKYPAPRRPHLRGVLEKLGFSLD